MRRPLAALLLLALVLAWVPAPPARAAPVFNVRDFGAAGDGLTDDSAAIQAAINRIDPAIGGTVYVPDGVYRVRYGAYASDITLQLSSNMTFQMSAGAEIKMDGTSYARYKIIHVTNASNVSIRGGTVTGERDTHVGTTGEYGFGISIWNSRDVTVSGVTARKCWGDGIYVDGWEGEVPDGIRVENCVMDANRRQGISIICGRNITVTGSTMINTEGAPPQGGLDLEPWNRVQVIEDVVITDNYFARNDCGIVAGGSEAPIRRVTITRNTIESNRNHGFWLDTVSDLVIRDNIVRDNPAFGLDILGCDGFALLGNSITANGAGINFAAGSRGGMSRWGGAWANLIAGNDSSPITVQGDCIAVIAFANIVLGLSD